MKQHECSQTRRLGLVITASISAGLTAGAAAQAFVPTAPTRSYAQKLVDKTLAENHNVLTMSIISRPEGSDKYQVIATNAVTSMGAASSESEVKVMRSGKPLVMGTAAEQPISVLLPLHDVKGMAVGVLNVTLPHAQFNETSALQHAMQLGAELEAVIPNITTFYDKFYYTAAPQDDLAMQIVSQEMIRHPDLWVLAFHCVPPGDTANRLVGINYLKLMNQRSEEGEDVLARNGNTALEAFPSTHRVETHIAMRDQKGRLIGTLATVYLYKDEADLATVLSRTVTIRDEVQRETPSLEALTKPVHP